MKSRNRICVIVSIVGGVVLTTAWWLHSGPDAHYRAHKDAESLWATLQTRLNAGDTLARVQRFLGPGEPAEDQEHLRAATRHFAALGGFYPDGTEDRDYFVKYIYAEPNSDSCSSGLYLQFRDGCLVNFDPEEFARCEPAAVALPQ